MVRFPHIVLLIFLALSTGRTALADNDATSTAPEQQESTYQLRPGDQLHIAVWKEEELDQELTLLPDGSIDFPLIGTIAAAGMTTPQLRDHITRELKPFIPAASVTVMVKETRGNSISVMGQVTRPGEVVMTRQMNVLQALSQVGGLTTFADGDDIVILRTVDGEKKSIPFDYDAVASGRKLETNIALEPGDVIVVPSDSLF